MAPPAYFSCPDSIGVSPDHVLCRPGDGRGRAGGPGAVGEVGGPGQAETGHEDGQHHPVAEHVAGSVDAAAGDGPADDGHAAGGGGVAAGRADDAE